MTRFQSINTVPTASRTSFVFIEKTDYKWSSVLKHTVEGTHLRTLCLQTSKCIRSFLNGLLLLARLNGAFKKIQDYHSKKSMVMLTLRDKPDHVVTFHYIQLKFHSPLTCSDLSPAIEKNATRATWIVGQWQLVAVARQSIRSQVNHCAEIYGEKAGWIHHPILSRFDLPLKGRRYESIEANKVVVTKE